MRLLSDLFPEQFPYHRSWKTSETHQAYWSVSATHDHVVPLSRGGDSLDPRNIVTACWPCNARKSDPTGVKVMALAFPMGKTKTGLRAAYFVGRSCCFGGEDAWRRRRSRPDQMASASSAKAVVSKTVVPYSWHATGVWQGLRVGSVRGFGLQDIVRALSVRVMWEALVVLCGWVV